MGRLMNVGFGNVVNTDKVIAVVSTDAAPVRRMLQAAREGGVLIDASCGRKTRSLIFTSSDYCIASALQPETLTARFNADPAGEKAAETGGNADA